MSSARSSRFRTLLRIARYAVLTAVVGFCLLLLFVRFVALPELENNRVRVADALSAQIGRHVELDAIATGWDGWNPRLDVRGLRIAGEGERTPIVELSRVRLVISWISLPLFDLHLKELVLTGPQLAVRRDTEGRVHIAGVTLDVESGPRANSLADWLLRQPSVVVRDAIVSWLDEKRAAPPLQLEHVDFRLENGFGRHRFGLRATPPAALAAPLDMRGQFSGGTAREWRSFSGRLYLRLDFADVAAWGPWLTLPLSLDSGQGALRLWADFTHGEPTITVADVVLSDVRGQFAPELPPLALSRLEGRLGWREEATQREITTQQLAFSSPDLSRFEPTDVKFVQRKPTARGGAGGSLEFDRVELGFLRVAAGLLPVPAPWRESLLQLSPRGRLDRGRLTWQGELPSPEHFSAAAEFTDLGFQPEANLPGLSGAAGSVEATELAGKLKLRSRNLSLALPKIFAESLHFDLAEADCHWQRIDQGVRVDIDRFAFANADASGAASGNYRTARDGPGSVDLTVHLTRAEVRAVPRYLPLQVSPSIRQWLRAALVAGTAKDARLKLTGNLDDFPYPDAKKGSFVVTARGEGVTLDYATGWPPITGLDATLRVEGSRMLIDGQRARIFGAALDHVRTEIPDLLGGNPLVRIDGSASGATADFFRFISESPVAGWLGHVTDQAQAMGNGSLALKFELPLANPSENRLSGQYTFAGDVIELGPGIPTLRQVNGILSFTELDAHATALTAEILGGPARLALSSQAGRLRVTGQGSVSVEQLRPQIPDAALAARLSGFTDWQGVISVDPEGTRWNFDSSLKGVSVDLPAPVGKPAAEAVALKIERRPTDATHDLLTVRYGSVGRIAMARNLPASGTPIIEKMVIALGRADADAARNGMWIRGDVPSVNLSAWLDLRAPVPPSGTVASHAGELPLQGIDLHAGALEIYGRQMRDLHLAATRVGADWQLALKGREISGTAHWEAPSTGRPNGRIVAKLDRLRVPQAAEVPVPDPSVGEAVPPTKPASVDHAWPEIELLAEIFESRQHELGRLELAAQPRGNDWQIQKLKLASDDGQLEAQGIWRSAGRDENTRLSTTLDVRDAGAYLARFGMPNAVRGGVTRITGELSWAGGPQDFDYPTLTGAFRLDTGPGQFTKLDPGIGKLLGMLSLQSLRRRLSFDFQDVFGEGFAFDEIKGDVRIENGVMMSDNLRIVGPSARVALSGRTDIAQETQSLKLRVQPSLSASLSVGAAALLLANPIVGAAVGAGSLLAQKMLQDPIEKIFSYEYAVTGHWSDPVVERVSTGTRALASPVTAAPAR